MSNKIPSITLQNQNKIPVLGLGTWRLYSKECTTVVQKAIEIGYTHFDTAEIYDNEADIGKAIKGIDRSKLFITSKVWYNHLHYNDVVKACENSLRKLGTSYLDLYLIHWPNSSVPMEETFKAMAELKKRELVKSIGVSNFAISHIEKVLQVSPVPIVTNQVEFHPHLYQKELLEYCTEHNIILTAWAPLLKVRGYNEPVLTQISNVHKKSVARVALRWLLHKGLIAIPKASSEKHLRENIDIFDWSLTADEITAIGNIPTEMRLIDLSFIQ